MVSHVTTVSVAEGPSFQCDEGDTLLRAALRAGVPASYECNSGGCGSCKLLVLDGTVAQLMDQPPGLSKRDIKKGKLLACQSVPSTDCTISWNLASGEIVPPLPRRNAAIVSALRKLTHDMREVTLRSEEPADFLPGQYAMLGLPGSESNSGPVRPDRAYSMSNLANDDGIWQFQVKRVPGGTISTQIVDGLAVGDRVELDGPFGLAHLQPGDRDVVCIAGGSGLAPMVSIARGLASQSDAGSRRLDFFYGGRSKVDLCASQFVDEISPSLKHTTLTEAISDESCPGWTGATGFIHDVVAAANLPDLHDRDIYVAGPPVMTDAVMRMLVLDLQIPVEQVHFDRFF